MESALGILFSWATKCGLGINPNKTCLVLFFRLPKLSGRELPLSSEVNYLGVALDSKLNWKQYTKERMKKGLNALYQCRNSISKSWGLSPRVVRWIYLAIVTPVNIYGCVV